MSVGICRLLLIDCLEVMFNYSNYFNVLELVYSAILGETAF